MSTRKNFFSKPTYHFFPTDCTIPAATTHDDADFDEADIWGTLPAPADANPRSDPTTKPIPSSRSKKAVRKLENPAPAVAAAGSLPINIPDWSKILREEFRRPAVAGYEVADDRDEGDVDGLVPPHEYLARTRVGSSFSVREGMGRTLKGRDLSRVRDAVWKQIGFQG